MAVLDQPVRDPHQDITSDEARVYLNTGIWGDPASLAITIQDAEQAEQAELNPKVVQIMEYGYQLG